MTSPESPTAPIRQHHRQMTATMEQLLGLIAAAQPGPGPAGPELARTMAALERSLRPHAEAEDCFLYPEVARLMSDHQVASSMTVDHKLVADHLQDLRAAVDAAAAPGAGLTAERLDRLDQSATRMAALLRAHFAREEQVFFPIIEARMTADEIRQRIIDPMNAMIGAAPAVPPPRHSRRKV